MELDINSIVKTEQKKLKLNMNKPIASGIVANTVKAPWYIRILPSFIPVPHRDYKAAKITQPQLEKILKASKEKVEAAKITQPQLEKMFKAKKEKEATFPENKDKKDAIKRVLNSYTALAAITAFSALTTYAFYEKVVEIDDREHQPYVNEANAHPEDLRWAKREMVKNYQDLQENDKGTSVYNLLRKAEKKAVQEAERIYPSDNFFHPKYNPNAPLSETTKVHLVFEDLALLSKELTPEEFDKMLPTYLQKDAPVSTLADPKKKIRDVAQQYKNFGNGRD